MSLVTVEDAAHRLPELIRESTAGAEIILTQDSLPVAKLIPFPKLPRKAGSAQSLPHFMADDFDAIPEGFEDYAPRNCSSIHMRSSGSFGTTID
jgi:antitoxin (DNA-binding transcriptional repressor) of toxin-antitoxin stability system